jgi:glycosyltransferase involved in cell wall biosynthesis
MDILFLDQFTEPGGAQQCLIDLLPAVIAHGWGAMVAAPGDGALAARAARAGAQFHPVRCGPFQAGRKSLVDLLRFAQQTPRLAREIARLPGDVIYVNGPRLLPAVPAGRPVIFHCHSVLRQRYAAWLAGRAIRRTRATLIGACRFVLEPLRAFAAAAHVVYNGVRASPQRQPGDTFRVGMIGRIAPEKGQAEFLRAARELSGCRFTICGGTLFGNRAYEDEIRALARGMPVEFIGWQEDASAVLARLDLLVVPSTVPEATPRVILEAFAAGVPVLASPCGGIPELIEHERTGFLIESLKPASLAAQMRALAALPAALASVAGNAFAAWRAHYTLAAYQRRILSIIETAAASSRG